MRRVTVFRPSPGGVYGQWSNKDVMFEKQAGFLQSTGSKRIQHVRLKCCLIPREIELIPPFNVRGLKVAKSSGWKS